MTKLDIITEIQERILANNSSVDERVITKQLIQEMLENFFDICKQSVSKGEVVELRGFGTFIRQILKPRKVKIPGKDDVIEIAKRARPIFKPATTFKNQVSENFVE